MSKNAGNANAALADLTPEHMAYFGGDLDLDDDDTDGLDRGDSFDLDAPPQDPDPEDEEEQVEQDPEPEQEDEGEDAQEPESESESEPEPESTDEEESEPEPEPEKKPAKAKSKDNEPRIPKSRFDEVNQERKELKRRLEELERNQNAAESAQREEYDFDKAEREYMELVLDGKLDEAGAKRREIREAERASVTAESSETAAERTRLEREAEKVTLIAAQYEAQYPALNNESEEYNEDAVEDVVDLYDTYLARGNAPSVAWKKALDKVVRIYDLDAAEAADDEEEEAEPAPKPQKNRQQQKANTKKKIGQAKKAPPKLAGAGAPSDSAGDQNLDIDQMTDEELDALPPSTLARIRGDVF